MAHNRKMMPEQIVPPGYNLYVDTAAKALLHKNQWGLTKTLANFSGNFLCSS